MKKTQKGFTIIEVALVLAIAALIFLTVFLAVPALQRNQRNDARHRDISNIVTAVDTYASNHPTDPLQDCDIDTSSGSLKDVNSKTCAKQLGNYLDTVSSNTARIVIKDVPDKAGTIETNIVGDVMDTSSKNGQYGDDNLHTDKIYIFKGASCTSTTKLRKSSARSYAVVGTTETTGDPEPYCSSAN